MESNAVDATMLAGSVTADDFSMFSLFLRADIVVKSVMVLLVMASVWSWAVIFDKLTSIRRLNAKATDFETLFWSGSALDDLYDKIGSQPGDPTAAVFVSAMREIRRKPNGGGSGVSASLSERIDRVMNITMSREMERIERNLTFLATTGATAPFIGLFGTVWGIMNSFQSIAVSHNTSLAVVAPGIAEALFATALGLLAAIPAVVAYNKISKDLDRYANRLDTFAGELSAILSRELEKRT
ncbi:MAG: protein TolQ [Rhodospirillales bacterium]